MNTAPRVIELLYNTRVRGSSATGNNQNIDDNEDKDIKKSMIFAVALAAMAASADEAFTFVNDGDYGYSYIQITQDLSYFSFKPDWHSLGNAGKVGYVVYTSDMSAADRAAYMETNANDPQFRMSVDGGVVDLGELKAGDRVGFYEIRTNGGTYTQSAFKEWNDTTWLAFDKNGGSGKVEWMSLGDVSYQLAGGGGTPAGAPLPGVLSALLVGGIGASALKAKKRKA